MINHDTPEVLALTDKSARELLVREKLIEALAAIANFTDDAMARNTASNAIKEAEWKAEWAAKDAARDAAKAKQAELERCADCYTDLLDALKDVCQAYSWLTFGEVRGWSESKPLTMQEALDKAKAVIKKAEGVQQ
jgi:hypothetical protein